MTRNRTLPAKEREARIAAERAEILTFVAASAWRQHVAAKRRGERSTAENDTFQEAIRRLIPLVGAEQAEMDFLFEAIDQRIEVLELGVAVELIRLTAKMLAEGTIN